MKTGASNLEINNALNKALRTDSVDYMRAASRLNASENGFKYNNSTQEATKKLKSGNTVRVQTMDNGKVAVEVSKAANNASNSLEYAMSLKTFNSFEKAYKYAGSLSKRY